MVRRAYYHTIKIQSVFLHKNYKIGSGVEAAKIVRKEGDISNPISFESCPSSTVWPIYTGFKQNF